MTIKSIYDGHDDIITGATTRSLRGVVILTERDTTWSATQVVRDPSSRVWEATTTAFQGSTTGSRTHLPVVKKGRIAWSDFDSFSGFIEVVNEGFSENCEDRSMFFPHDMFVEMPCFILFLSRV